MFELEATASLIDGEASHCLAVDDRGLNYGDGLFETVWVHAGHPVWWAEHLGRLRLGARRLAIAAPTDEVWDADATRLLAVNGEGQSAVLKLILTRGSGGRGYSPSRATMPRRILQLSVLPSIDPRWRREGIALRMCDLRLSIQPRLAGIKHLNRLEQVLARAEWDDADIQEGLLQDADDNIVCATAANLFLVKDGQLFTPAVEHCGVAGICRAQLIANAKVSVQTIASSDLLASDELFVCSSLRGILPVAALGRHRWPVGPITRQCMAVLADLHPAFADPLI